MRTKITLACTECKQRNYNMTKDKKTHPDRMETKKYCRFCKSNEKAPKKDFIKGLKAEFNKIIWPDKETLTKQSIVVIVSTIALGIVIAVLDLIIKFGLNIVIG